MRFDLFKPEKKTVVWEWGREREGGRAVNAKRNQKSAQNRKTIVGIVWEKSMPASAIVVVSPFPATLHSLPSLLPHMAKALGL